MTIYTVDDAIRLRIKVNDFNFTYLKSYPEYALITILGENVDKLTSLIKPNYLDDLKLGSYQSFTLFNHSSDTYITPL